MKIRLTKKFAECIDGVDLARRRVGDVIDLPYEEARILLAHEWAVALDAIPPDADRRLPANPPADEQVTIFVPLKPDDEPA